MPALVALGSWLLGHQAIAAAFAIYFGAAAAGVDLVDKVIKLEHDVQAEHVMPAAAHPQPNVEEPAE